MVNSPNRTPPVPGTEPALHESIDQPITKPVYHGKDVGAVSKAGRIREWSEAVSLANANPQMVMTEFGRVAVEEIGPARFADDREVWERQPGENDWHWHMFILYRDQASWDRTKKNVARLVKSGGGSGTPETIVNLASMFRWDERVMAFDRSEDNRMREELYQRKLTARIETARVGRKMREKSLEALDVLDAIVYKQVKDPETGEVKRIMRSALSPSDIVKLADVGVKLERLALGEDEMALPPGATINLTQINTQLVGMSDEELVANARKIIGPGTGDIVTVGDDGLPHLDGS